MQTSLEFRTDQRIETKDITARIADTLPAAVPTGLCHVFVPHTTAGVFVNEAESRLLSDVEDLLSGLVPADETYAHDTIDDNAAAHLRSMLLGSSVVIPIAEGELGLGTWQRVLLVESDGPRERSVTVTALET